MSTVSSAILSLTPYHLFAYGTLLGTEVYQVCEIAMKFLNQLSDDYMLVSARTLIEML